MVQDSAADFDDLLVGEDLGEYHYRLTPGMILTYLEALGESARWYERPSPLGEEMVPPLVCDKDLMHLPGVRERVIAGGTQGEVANRKQFLHARQAYQLLNSPVPGKRITVRGRITDKYEKSGRKWLLVEALSVDEDGREILRSTCTYCWLS